MYDRLPVLVGPARIGDSRILYFLKVIALNCYRNRQPLGTGRRLDQVTIAPVSSGVLHVVEEDEFVDRIDQIEVTLPGNVVRLNNRYFLGWQRCQRTPILD